MENPTASCDGVAHWNLALSSQRHCAETPEGGDFVARDKCAGVEVVPRSGWTGGDADGQLPVAIGHVAGPSAGSVVATLDHFRIADLGRVTVHGQFLRDAHGVPEFGTERRVMLQHQFDDGEAVAQDREGFVVIDDGQQCVVEAGALGAVWVVVWFQ